MPNPPVLNSKTPSPGAHEELALIGFRVDAQRDGPQFYTLLAVGGENERPLTADGRILFFSRPELAPAAMALDPSMAALGNPPQDVETLCDVAHALYLVNSQKADPDGAVLDCLLIFDDLVRASRISMPERFQGILTELAARLAEGDPLGKIFSSEALREHVEDALLWCVGAVTVRARLISE